MSETLGSGSGWETVLECLQRTFGRGQLGFDLRKVLDMEEVMSCSVVIDMCHCCPPRVQWSRDAPGGVAVIAA